MKKSLLEIYSLVVCFVSVICLVITLGMGVYYVSEMANPTLTENSSRYRAEQAGTESDKQPGELKKYAAMRSAKVKEAVQHFIMVLIAIVIDLIIFFFHWRLLKQTRETVPAG